MTHRDLTDRQAETWARYQRMRVRLAGRLNRELAHATGLSEADFEILAALIEAPDASMRALSLRCGLDWEKSRLSHQVRRMEKRGLVVREPCAEDSRSAVVRVTAAGRRHAEAARACYERAVREHVVDALTPRQLEALGAIADAVLARLDEERLA